MPASGAGTQLVAIPEVANRITFALIDDVGRKYSIVLAPGQIFSLRGKSIKRIALIGSAPGSLTNTPYMYAAICYSI